MLQNYDLSLVIASYVVAVLAAYTALYFGTRLNAARGGERRRWLVTGALVMGSGVWTMHFVGMRAMPMEAPISFDTLMTTVSWLAAVVASGVALNIIGRARLSVGAFAAATLAMSGGVVVMHYLGVYAMRMSAEPVVNAGFLVLSVIIAVAASGAALAMCRKLQGMQGGSVLWLQLLAALVMAAAICGMHYTGMIALQFPADAVPAPDNGLRGDWIGIPLAVACVVFLTVALVVTIRDVRLLRALEIQKAEESRLVERMAFQDSVTGLPNRSALEQKLLEHLARPDARDLPFALVYLDIANFRELSDRLGHRELDDGIREIGTALRADLTDTVYLARYSSSAFIALVPDHENSRHAFMYKRLRQIDEAISIDGLAITWRAGQSVYPTTGTSSRKLVRAAMLPRDLNAIGTFADMEANPELALPGQLSGS